MDLTVKYTTTLYKGISKVYAVDRVNKITTYFLLYDKPSKKWIWTAVENCEPINE